MLDFHTKLADESLSSLPKYYNYFSYTYLLLSSSPEIYACIDSTIDYSVIVSAIDGIV